MGKAGATILGFALLAGAAIIVGRSFLLPAAERSERDGTVLTGGLDPRIESVEVLEDSDLPPGVNAPKVDEDLIYIRVDIFYPERESFPAPDAHHLTGANRETWFESEPVHSVTETTEDGARAVLIYSVGTKFEWGRIAHGKLVIAERFEVD